MLRYLILCATLGQSLLCLHAQDSLPVGPTGGGHLVPTGQLIRPAGKTVAYPGRPVDLALAPDGSFLVAKDHRGLVFVDPAPWEIQRELPFPGGGGASLHGLAISPDNKTVYATNSGNKVQIARQDDAGKWAYDPGITLPAAKVGGPPYPTGITLFADGARALVCLSRSNSVGVLDLTAGKLISEIPVGVAPYAVVITPDQKTAYVSNWGGRMAKAGDLTALSAGTPTVIDERGIAKTGTVGKLDLGKNEMVAEYAVGLHPAGLALSADGGTLYVANANSDTVSMIPTAAPEKIQTVIVRPDPNLPFGSLTNALCLSPDGKTLFAANGGNNAVAVLDLTKDQEPKITGFIPTGWFPGGVITNGRELFIANVKGEGSRTAQPNRTGFNSHQHRGSLTQVTIPTAEELAAYTKQVLADSRVPQVLAQAEKAQADVPPVPLPARAGEPSHFEHVVYIIKENRTYDQVFGKLKQGNGMPELCIYGPDVTPNHHALAEEFVLLDNFYCNGVLSADGHSWATEGIVTDHLEKAFGGFNRSYTFGDDPLTYSSAGFLWDNALLHGKTFRNYGELVYTEAQPGGFKQIWEDFDSGANTLKITNKCGIENLVKYTAPDYPGWNMNIPDVLRAERFLTEFRAAEKSGEWHNLVIMHLPQDHASGLTPGMPTPQAHVADNDLALGRIVEAISNSKFWPKTCIFVIEDDPQDGWDHVDGHRSICLVISPYTKRKAVVSNFYNQSSVVHTIERILGLPHLNQLDGLAPLMRECFTEQADVTPFTARPAQIKLNQLTLQKNQLPAKLRELAELSERQDLTLPDRIDDDAMNRILWHAVKGEDIPYPAAWAGAHGRGLAGLKLQLSPTAGEEDDD
ncbi:MAG: bifunctional YncE family protein/alkaline phosphatase family protein [Pirellulales bacterium]|nr:bifunctional YncE family protein/alkaline phosphatase family protein [Pirellulales bacterium]